jgi:uncharacterized repeat protein (TIGR01451 family)
LKRNSFLSIFIITLLCLPIFTITIPQTDARPTPGIRVTTTTDKTNAQVGEKVIFTFEVTNTGTVTLFNVQVDSDPVGPTTKLSESGRRANDKLESGETWIYTADYTIKDGDNDPFVNTVTATADTRKGIEYSDTDTHGVYLYGTQGDMIPEVLTSPNQEPNGGWYGCSVAIGEGLIIVGAAYESTPVATPLGGTINTAGKPSPMPTEIYGAGRVYVYSATNGALLETLTSPNPTSPGWFGYSVAVGEGVIIIGAPKETSGTVASAGNVYIYNAETLAYIDTLTSSNPVSNGDGQGYGVSVAINNGIIAVGSSWETVEGFAGAGRVYLYNVADRTSLSFSPLVSQTPQYPGRFGYSVAVGEGIIVVGAPYESFIDGTDVTDGAGQVYIYNAATGALTDTETSPNAEFAGHFGFSVAVGGGLIAIGAFDETVAGNEDAGRAYIYDLTDKAIVHTLESQNPEYRGFFGNSVATGDGAIIIGAELESSGSYPDAGKAYVFNAATGAYSNTLTMPNPQDWDSFGWSVAVGSGVIAVGAYDAVFLFE